MGRKTIVVYSIILCILISLFSFPVSAAVQNENTGVYDDRAVAKIMDKTNILELKAKSAVLLDATSGNFLMEKNSHEKVPIASVTKIMSMLLIMEAIDSGKIKYEDMVPVSEHSYNMGGSQVYLKPGEEFTVLEMLKAITIHSANDATVAMSEKISGAEDTFVTMMNDKAKELGMNDTNFKDCTGLNDEGQSSAHDVALMSRALIMKHPKILEITTIWHDTFRNGQFSLDNTNKMIRFYQGANGLKTGFTTKAGYNLSAAAKRNNMQLVSVVLGEADSDTRFAESKKLLDYGFANYEVTHVNKKGDQAGSTDVKKGVKTKVNAIYGEEVNLLLNKGVKGKIEREVKLAGDLEAPVKAGQKIGEVTYKISQKEVGKCDLVAEVNVDKASFVKLFFRMILSWVGIGRS